VRPPNENPAYATVIWCILNRATSRIHILTWRDEKKDLTSKPKRKIHKKLKHTDTMHIKEAPLN